ncbi:hypothetical protein ABPG75_011571 [Micractinium tetrahymenae]
MEPGAIELRAGAGAIAARNEEINRRRLAAARAGASGPLRVTDPAALARLMDQMKAQADQQRAAEAAREEERKRREGAAYRKPEERAAAARAAKSAGAGEGEEEARVLEKRFDPQRDYYVTLGIPRSASAAEVRRAYKRLALLSHPDKFKDAASEEQAAVADKFKLVVEAFDVLSDEEQRAVYDKCRDYMEANPGRGLPVLSPEEAALMRSGAAELARLRRQGAKSVKHASLEREVYISLEKLNSGCTKTVAVGRRRVAPDGREFASTKNIHLVLRRGSREGDRHVFEGDGCEGVDTLPGDLVLVLRQKPHPVFRRVGDKDLEVFAQALAPGEVLFAVEVPTIQKKRLLLTGSAFREAALHGGAGGVWQAVLPGQGLADAAEPWERPAGSLTVRLRYPACFLDEAAISSCLAPQPVHLLGCERDVVAAALAAGSIAGMLAHQREAAEMAAEVAAAADRVSHEGVDSIAARDRSSSQGDSPRSVGGSSSSSSRRGSKGEGGRSSPIRGPTAFCLVLDLEGCLASRSPTQSGCTLGCSPAAAAMLRALRSRVPGLRAQTARASRLLDDEWAALQRASVIILDAPLLAGGRSGDYAASAATGSSSISGGGTDGGGAAAGAEQLEQLLASSAEYLAGTGLLELLWQRFWSGALLAGIGEACALLGRQAGGSTASVHSAPPILPWFLLRAGGGAHGWASLQAALSAPAAAAAAARTTAPATAGEQPLMGAGVMASGCWLVHPTRGHAELLVAPCRDALVATAAWVAQPENDPCRQGLEEADADWGFFCELTTCS